MSMTKIDIEQIKADREFCQDVGECVNERLDRQCVRDGRLDDLEDALIEAVDLLDSMAYDDYVPNSRVRKFLERFE